MRRSNRVPVAGACSLRSTESCARAPHTCRSTRSIPRCASVRSLKKAVPGLSWPEPNTLNWPMNSVLVASSRALLGQIPSSRSPRLTTWLTSYTRRDRPAGRRAWKVEHRSVVNRLQWMQRRYALGPDDVILQKTPVTFDVSVWELMWWAMAGASVALLEPGGERDPRKIVAAVERHRVTVIHFVPSMLGPFLDQLEAQPDSMHRLTSLHTVFCSGEALSAGAGRAVQPGIRRHRGAAAGESLRSDRGDGRRELLRLPVGRAGRGGPDRKADRQHNIAGSRRARKPLPGGSAG